MNFIRGILLALGGAVLIAFAALFTGTVLWIAWPYALPVLLPKLVSLGWIPTHIPWWSGVCFCWFWAMLFGTTKPEIKTK